MTEENKDSESLKVVFIEELLAQLKKIPNKIFEVSFMLRFNARATHFISYINGGIKDEGIDGETTEWSEEDFKKHYEFTCFTVWN